MTEAIGWLLIAIGFYMAMHYATLIAQKLADDPPWTVKRVAKQIHDELIEADRKQDIQ